MKSIADILAVLVFAAGTAVAQTTIDQNSVTNAASYLSPGLPNYGIAQGSMFIVKGQNLGSCPTTLPPPLPLPTTMNGTGVKITVGGTTVDAFMVYVYCPEGATGATQIAAIAPSNTPVGNGSITIKDKTAPIKVVKTAFGMFTVNQAGSGPAIVQNYVSATSTPTNLLTEAAYPGQPVILWGTGLGPIAGNDAGTPPVGNLDVDVQVFVGGKQANVFYKGRSAEFPGIDQINFYLPMDLEGCYVPVVVKAGGVVSNFGSVAIAKTGKVCSDPNGFTVEELNKLASGSLNFGNVSLSRLVLSVPQLGELATDSGSGTFLHYLPNTLVAAQLPLGTSLYGTCLVFTYTGANPFPVDPIKPAGLDAGAKLTVSGPKGQKDLPANATVKGVYSATLGGGSTPFGGGQPPYLDPGAYTITGPGGADIGAFSVPMSIPQWVTWTNRDAITSVPLSQNLNITWTGGDPGSYVAILGASATSNQIGAAFLCTEKTSVGHFTVPVEVLMSLPQSAIFQGSSTGYLAVSNSGVPVRFQASGCDVCAANYTITNAKTVNFQ